MGRFPKLFDFSGDLVRVREQCQETGSFYSRSEHALILGLGARDTTGQDFAAVGNELSQETKVFVVDRGDLVGRKVARLSAGPTTATLSFEFHKSSGSFSLNVDIVLMLRGANVKA